MEGGCPGCWHSGAPPCYLHLILSVQTMTSMWRVITPAQYAHWSVVSPTTTPACCAPPMCLHGPRLSRRQPPSRCSARHRGELSCRTSANCAMSSGGYDSALLQAMCCNTPPGQTYSLTICCHVTSTQQHDELELLYMCCADLSSSGLVLLAGCCPQKRDMRLSVSHALVYMSRPKNSCRMPLQC